MFLRERAPSDPGMPEAVRSAVGGPCMVVAMKMRLLGEELRLDVCSDL
jgi:hypothetical protein